MCDGGVTSSSDECVASRVQRETLLDFGAGHEQDMRSVHQHDNRFFHPWDQPHPCSGRRTERESGSERGRRAERRSRLELAFTRVFLSRGIFAVDCKTSSSIIDNVVLWVEQRNIHRLLLLASAASPATATATAAPAAGGQSRLRRAGLGASCFVRVHFLQRTPPRTRLPSTVNHLVVNLCFFSSFFELDILLAERRARQEVLLRMVRQRREPRQVEQERVRV